MSGLTLGLAGGLNVRAIRQLVRREPITGRLGTFDFQQALRDPQAAARRLRAQMSVMRGHSNERLVFARQVLAESQRLLAAAPTHKRRPADTKLQSRRRDFVERFWPTSQSLSALHEVGHVLGGYLHDVPVLRCFIEGTEAGTTIFSTLAGLTREERLDVGASGWACMSLLHGQGGHYSDSDQHLGLSPPATESEMLAAKKRVTPFLRANWLLIKALAKELCIYQKLSGTEIKGMIGRFGVNRA